MTRIDFQKPDGSPLISVEAPTGARVLEVAQGAGLPLEGACEGAMACSTCHVLVARESWARFAPPGEHEEDMLDFAAYAAPTSRLSCQLHVPDGEPIVIRMPRGHADVRS